MLDLVAVLDPRVTYEGLKRQALRGEDPGRREDYLKQINYAVDSLREYYLENYVLPTSALLSNPADNTPKVSNTPKPFDFFAIYASSTTMSPTDELDQYVLLPPLGFGKQSCDPISWWKSNVNQYPNLVQLARDILSIPGSFTWLSVTHITC